VQDFEYNITLNRLIYIKEIDKSLFLTVADIQEADLKDKNTICLDYDLIKGKLIARSRRAGDSMIPCGMTGSKKIKDIFIDLKIPAEDRNKKLIIADDDNILWLEGYRISDRYKVSAATKKILKISMGGNNL